MTINSQCMFCKNYKGVKDNDNYMVKHFCSAFPDGIPNGIFFSKVLHNKPYKGDHGIQFEANLEKDYEDHATIFL